MAAIAAAVPFIDISVYSSLFIFCLCSHTCSTATSAGFTPGILPAAPSDTGFCLSSFCLAGETAVLPVLVGKDEDAWLLSNELKKRGVSVPPAMYPAVPKGKARLRFCVISEHKPEQIEKALDILESTAREFGIELPRRNYDKVD